jgi:hypothetical protein
MATHRVEMAIESALRDFLAAKDALKENDALRETDIFKTTYEAAMTAPDVADKDADKHALAVALKFYTKKPGSGTP